jgi:Ca2+-binding EF-hand superfamily protein
MEKLSLAAVIGAMMLLAAPATAQTRMSMPSFEQLDTDSTGSLSLDAFQAGLQQHREAARDVRVARMMEHANEDGTLDEAGLRAGFAQMRADGRADMATRLFSRIDRNADGVIDAVEYTRFAEMMEKRGHQGRNQMRGRN